MSPTRVIIVDDNDVIRAGIRRIVELGPEFTVVGEARDGVEATEISAKTTPDIALLDLRMPLLDGASATRRITSEMPGVKVVLVTSDDSGRAERLAEQSGAVAIVTKDKCAEMLLPTLREVARGIRFLNPPPAPPAESLPT